MLFDGLNPVFYRRFWDMCGDDNFQACIRWLNEGTIPLLVIQVQFLYLSVMLQTLRETYAQYLYAMLFIKFQLKPQLIDYKRCFLAKCISKEQSGFVSGRSILDNVLVAAEIIHYLRCKIGGKKAEAALKIDISKSCDRADRGYLLAILQPQVCQQMDWLD